MLDNSRKKIEQVNHHHHIYFRLPERPQKPIEPAAINDKTAKKKTVRTKKYKK